MSYKITSLSITNRPIFKIFVKNPLFLNFFLFFPPFPWFTFFRLHRNDKKKNPAINGRAKHKRRRILLFGFLFEDCSGGLRAEDVLNVVGKPVGIVIKAKILVKAIEIFIANGDIEADAVVQLAQANWAKIEWPRVAFL
jgi:hypothetical protein